MNKSPDENKVIQIHQAQISFEHDLIVDPFLGSGTTALASERLNRRFIGTDMDIDAINISLSRLVQT